MSEHTASLPFLSDILFSRAQTGPVPDKSPQAWRTWLEVEVGALTRQSDPAMIRRHLVSAAAMMTAWAEQLDRDAGVSS